MARISLLPDDRDEPTFSGVMRVKRVFFHGPAATNAKQPGQDDKHEQHGGEGQGDLLGCGQNHPPGTRFQTGDTTPGRNDGSRGRLTY